MRSCCLVLVLVGAISVQAARTRPVPGAGLGVAKPTLILRGGAGGKDAAPVPRLDKGRVQTVLKCIQAVQVLTGVQLFGAFIAIMFGYRNMAWSHLLANDGDLRGEKQQCLFECRADSYFFSSNPELRGCMDACLFMSRLTREVGVLPCLLLALVTPPIVQFIALHMLRVWRPQEFDQACMDTGKTPWRLHEVLLAVASIIVNTFIAYQISLPYRYMTSHFPSACYLALLLFTIYGLPALIS